MRADLERRQLVETRQLHKSIKSETKVRTAQFKKSQRISANASVSAEQELERLKEVRVMGIEAACDYICTRVHIYWHLLNKNLVSLLIIRNSLSFLILCNIDD